MAGWQAPRSDDWPFVGCRLSAGRVPAACDRIGRRRLRSQRTLRGSGSHGPVTTQTAAVMHRRPAGPSGVRKGSRSSQVSDAEHGADVLHVGASHLEGGGLFELKTGIGKRQAVLDLDVAEQARAMRDLIRGADVFSQGYRLGTLDRRGFSPGQVAALRPGIVYVSENCYGHLGPWSERPGWEQLGQAATGMAYREGLSAPDGVPRLAPAAVSDYSTGHLAAYGAMMALARRAREGGSWHVRASLSQTCMCYQRLGDDNDPGSAVMDANSPTDVEPYLAQMNTADFGRIQYLTPALHLAVLAPRPAARSRPQCWPRPASAAPPWSGAARPVAPRRRSALASGRPRRRPPPRAGRRRARVRRTACAATPGLRVSYLHSRTPSVAGRWR